MRTTWWSKIDHIHQSGKALEMLEMRLLHGIDRDCLPLVDRLRLGTHYS